MLNELGGEVVAAGIGSLLLRHVKDENLCGLLAGNRLLYRGDLLLHGADNLLRLVLYLKDAAEIVEILIDVLQIGAQLIAFNGGQGHDAVLGEGVMLGIVLLAEGAGAAVDEVRLHVQNSFQAGFVIHLWDCLIFLPELRCNLGVVVGCGDNSIPQAQRHQLVASVDVGAENGFRHIGEGNLRAVLGD